MFSATLVKIWLFYTPQRLGWCSLQPLGSWKVHYLLKVISSVPWGSSSIFVKFPMKEGDQSLKLINNWILGIGGRCWSHPAIACLQAHPDIQKEHEKCQSPGNYQNGETKGWIKRQKKQYLLLHLKRSFFFFIFLSAFLLFSLIR